MQSGRRNDMPCMIARSIRRNAWRCIHRRFPCVAILSDDRKIALPSGLDLAIGFWKYWHFNYPEEMRTQIKVYRHVWVNPFLKRWMLSWMFSTKRIIYRQISSIRCLLYMVPIQRSAIWSIPYHWNILRVYVIEIIAYKVCNTFIFTISLPNLIMCDIARQLVLCVR